MSTNPKLPESRVSFSVSFLKDGKQQSIFSSQERSIYMLLYVIYIYLRLPEPWTL